MKNIKKLAYCFFSIMMVSILLNYEIVMTTYAKAGSDEDIEIKTDEYGLPIWEEPTDDKNMNRSSFGITVPEEKQLIDYEGVSEEGYDVVVKNGKKFELIANYNTYEEALNAYNYQNSLRSTMTPAIVKNRSVVKYNTALVSFRSGFGSTLDIFANENLTDKITYIESSGSYGADALYLNTSNNGAAIQIKLSGVTGWVSASSVTIATDLDNTYSSYYKVDSNNMIKHYINLNVNDYNAYTVVNVGLNEIGLSKNKAYFSYDGHYFYEDYAPMTNDYRNNSYSSAVNANKPYYNYYQYVSHRTQSAYGVSDLGSYLTDRMGLTSKITTFNAGSNGLHSKTNESMLYGEQNAFIEQQNKYGANGVMMLSLALNESGRGRSSISFNTNNVFGHAAYDSDPSNHATKYKNVSKSIEAHAKVFISDTYADPTDYIGRGNGSFFGDKGSGMNVDYASDPYWGEKAASYYHEIDSSLGKKDYQDKTLGIVNENISVDVKKETEDSSKTLYTISNLPSYSFVILGEKDGYYKIQSDPTLNANRTGIQQSKYVYDFDADYGYVKKSDIAHVFGDVEDLGSDPEPTYVKGDVNGDGKITAMDYVLIKNHILGLESLSGRDLKAGDVNGDGKITAMDYVLVKNHILGISEIK